MSLARDQNDGGARASPLEWLPVLAGLLMLYAPVFYHLAVWHWPADEGAHGPVILAVVVWLIWRRRAALFVNGGSSPISGFCCLVAGLAIYVVGRSNEIALFEIGALLPILTGVVIAMRGWEALRALWFPIFFVAFMVPLPGLFVDALTGPLKHVVSDITTRVLYPLGYPIGRDGVIITVGQYQLLVADACSGINSMFSLSALGLLFVHVMARPSMLHNAVILASILPIALVSNVIRVIALILITYHLGDDAGQGFLHGAAGMLLLIAAVALLVGLDAILARTIKPTDPLQADARAI
jgi:exosortase B